MCWADQNSYNEVYGQTPQKCNPIRSSIILCMFLCCCFKINAVSSYFTYWPCMGNSLSCIVVALSENNIEVFLIKKQVFLEKLAKLVLSYSVAISMLLNLFSD